MRKRTTAALAALGLLIAAGSWSANTAIASAHTPQASLTCDAATVSLTSYDRHATADITLDGEPVHTGTFGGHLVESYPTEAGADTHVLTVHVVSADSPRYNYDDTFTATGCGPVAPPSDVIAPHVQDYITCDGAAFVLDNTESTVDVTYTVAGTPFYVAAGAAVHTDADGFVIPSDKPITITTMPGDRTWTFEPASACAGTPPTQEPTTPPTDEPTTPPTDEPTTPPVTTPPSGEPSTPTSPSSEPTAPAPSHEPSTPATASPTPTAGTTPPASSGTDGSTPSPRPSSHSTPTTSATPSVVPVAADTSRRTLAFTGSDVILPGTIIALSLLALGAFVLVHRHTARRRAIDAEDDR